MYLTEKVAGVIVGVAINFGGIMSKFELEDSIEFLIHRTGLKLKSALVKRFTDNGYDVTNEQWGVLSVLYNNEGCTQSEIADILGKDKTNITRILDVMQKKNMIVRTNDESDRRMYRIYLTEEGKNLELKLIPIVVDMKKSIEDFTEDEIEKFKTMINKIYDSL